MIPHDHESCKYRYPLEESTVLAVQEAVHGHYYRALHTQEYQYVPAYSVHHHHNHQHEATYQFLGLL